MVRGKMLILCGFLGLGGLLIGNVGCGGGNGTNVGSIAPIIKTTSLPGGREGVAYSETLTASGGTAPYTWSVTSGSLPAGLNLAASTGIISGTATAMGTSTFTVQVSDAATPPGTQTASLSIAMATPITHVVIIFQENRTPDNLFNDPVLYNAPPAGHGADIAQSGTNSQNQTVTLTPTNIVTDYDLSHAHSAWERMCFGTTGSTVSTDACTMNGADLIAQTCATGATDCPNVNLGFQYVAQQYVQPYWTMAETYTFGDRMFQTNQGPSYLAHQYIISGTSATGTGSTTFFAENPQNVYGDNTGCTSPTASDATPDVIQTIDTSNPNYPANEDPTNSNSPKLYPCVDHNTLIDLLDAQSISWKYYGNIGTCTAGSACPSGIWIGPNVIKHICVPDSTNSYCTGSDWVNVVPNTNVLNDIPAGNLAAVTWVIPDGKNSDHANSNDGGGPDWVTSIVNAIGTSPYWANTAIIVTWDDWGGWYDHVVPESLPSGYNSSYEYGFRVPLIVISPYAKAAYVSHVDHDFGSILKFTETTFGLGEIDSTDQYADSRADDLSDCFNYSQTPLTFSQITPLKHDAKFFLNDKRPPVDPDDE